MAKNLFQPVRMESQFLATALETVKVWDGTDEQACIDGQLVTLGDFIPADVYTDIYTANGMPANDVANIIDINTRYATLPAADAGDVWVIDLANVPNAINGDNVYRIGVNTVGLTAAAGVPVRARRLVKNDTFVTGAENCTGALTVGQFAAVDATGKWKAAATAPASGTYCKVIASITVSEGVRPTTPAYRMLVMAEV